MLKCLAVSAVMGVLIGVCAVVVFAGYELDQDRTEAQVTPTVPPETWTRLADGAVMVLVPAGEFQMGSSVEEVDQALAECSLTHSDCEPSWFESETPAHVVVLRAFWLDRMEVTNAQYQRCVDAGACEKSGYADDPDYNSDVRPIVGVNWDDAQSYCQWAGARLPTEAEWEYAARGPKGWVYPWGNKFDGARLNFCDKDCGMAWSDQAADDGYALTSPVGSYPGGVSWCGVLDLAGNVWEWVADRYERYPTEQQVNPTGPTSGEIRVLRGGSDISGSIDVRSAVRFWISPDRFYDVGFRCARNS